MSPGSILFAICALLCLAGALIVVLSGNPIRSALGLLTTIAGIAGLFLKLDAQFLATIQLLVYAGAVVILFVFVIMLLGSSSYSDQARGPAHTARLIAGGVMGAFGLFGILNAVWASTNVDFPKAPLDHGSVVAVGSRIFKEGLVPFELATVLLIVAVIGAIALARSQPHKKAAPKLDHPTKRFFHGPLLDRDGVRPLAETRGQGGAGSGLAGEATISRADATGARTNLEGAQ